MNENNTLCPTVAVYVEGLRAQDTVGVGVGVGVEDPFTNVKYPLEEDPEGNTPPTALLSAPGYITNSYVPSGMDESYFHAYVFVFAIFEAI